MCFTKNELWTNFWAFYPVSQHEEFQPRPFWVNIEGPAVAAAMLLECPGASHLLQKRRWLIWPEHRSPWATGDDLDWGPNTTLSLKKKRCILLQVAFASSPGILLLHSAIVWGLWKRHDTSNAKIHIELEHETAAPGWLWLVQMNQTQVWSQDTPEPNNQSVQGCYLQAKSNEQNSLTRAWRMKGFCNLCMTCQAGPGFVQHQLPTQATCHHLRFNKMTVPFHATDWNLKPA